MYNYNFTIIGIVLKYGYSNREYDNSISNVLSTFFARPQNIIYYFSRTEELSIKQIIDQNNNEFQSLHSNYLNGY